jgi:hypothetical protein
MRGAHIFPEDDKGPIGPLTVGNAEVLELPALPSRADALGQIL